MTTSKHSSNDTARYPANSQSVITVHGLRDDRSTCWKSKSGKPWLRDNLFETLSIRQLDYSYATNESARIFRPGGVRAEAQNLLRLYSENRRDLETASL